MKHATIAVMAAIAAFSLGACSSGDKAEGSSPELILPESPTAEQLAAWNAMPDTPGTGPYPATMEVDPALPDFIVYRPQDLSSLGEGKLGLFVWGNGGCSDDAASARLHLAEIASHGYIAIAPGQWRSGPNATAPQPEPAGTDIPLTFPTSADDLREALNWALSDTSPFAGKIDQNAIAVGGFSCGGIQAIAVGSDPRIDTVVVQNSGLFSDPAMAVGEMGVSKDALQALHTPVIYVMGGPSDIAWENGKDDFARISHIPAVIASMDVGHGGTYNEPNGGKAAQIVTDWLEWQLRGDAAAKAAFTGPDCKWCTDEAVTLETKNLPE